MEEQRDPLAECLAYLAKHYGKYVSSHTLVGDLPLESGILTPKLFSRAAEKINFKTQIIRHGLKNLNNVFLPCILILNENDSCVLLSLEDSTAKIVRPSGKMDEEVVSLEQLSESFTNFIILTSPSYEADSRASNLARKDFKQWFWEVIWGYRRDYVALIFATLLTTLFALAMPIFVMNVYDRVLPNSAFVSLWTLATGVFIVVSFEYFVKWARTSIIETYGKKIDMSLASKLFSKVLGTQLDYCPKSLGAFATNLRDFESLRSFFTSTTITSLVDLPFVLVFFIIIAVFSTIYMLIVPCFIALAIFFFSYLMYKKRMQNLEHYMQANALKQACVVEAVAGLEDIKSLNAVGAWQRRWENHAVVSANAGEKMHLYNELVNGFNRWVMALNTVGVVIVGAYLFSMNKVSMGGIIAAVMLSSRALTPLMQVSGLMQQYEQSKMSLGALNTIFQMPSEQNESKGMLHRPALQGDYELVKVNYSYPQSSINALQEVSLTIKKGEKVAILGPVGSGKTTLLKLLMGFSYASRGDVLLDGTDITQIEPNDLRENISYGTQFPTLFHGTLKSNILLGKKGVRDEALIKAAKMACLDTMINRSKAGFDMLIEERGSNLSGGQRQMISLARIFAGQPNILLFDEPFGSMDSFTEQKIISNLTDFIADKTLVVVTHRPSMLKLVDRIIVLNQGRIVADGSRDTVLKKLGFKQNSNAGEDRGG